MLKLIILSEHDYPFEDGINHLLFEDPRPEEYGLDPNDVDEKEWQESIELAKIIAYQVAEGVIEVERDEDGQFRLYPK